eukprot:Gb_06004 [translate_table: standard]
MTSSPCSLSGCDSILAPFFPITPGTTISCFSLEFARASFHRNGFHSLSLSANIVSRASYFCRRRLQVCFVKSDNLQRQTETDSVEDGEDSAKWAESEVLDSLTKSVKNGTTVKLSERAARRRAERHAYLFAAVASSIGITSMAAFAVYYRFAWQMQGGEVPFTEMFGTFSLAVGATVGMEFWARWAHRALWHASLWHMHESHHQPRDGPFELNDVFAIINAVPAIALLAYGFFNKGLVPGLCFGAGLGITVFGMAYMFVHDGLVHRRFPVGPIADVPYLLKVAAAHQLHHADKFSGVPYGLFLGPKELEEVGGLEELEKLIKSKIKASKGSLEGEKI